MSSRSDDGHHRISPTAHYTAWVWHRLGLPHAELFATARGRRLFWAFRAAGEWVGTVSPRVPSMEHYLAYRHRLIDARLRALEPDMLVELAAGLSRRGVTWAVDHGVPVLEVDLPHMVEAKRRRLERAPPAVLRATRERLEQVSSDVLDPAFGELLTERIARAERPAVVAEGLLGYFDLAQRRRLLTSVAAALRARGRGWMLCDLHTRERQHEVRRAARYLRLVISVVTRGQRALAPFDDDAHVERFFLDAGFDAAAAVDAREHLLDDPALAGLRSPAAIWQGTVRG